MTALADLPIRSVKIEKIDVPERHRDVDYEAVASLRQSIEEIGLRTPISVSPTDDGYMLNSGRSTRTWFVRSCPPSSKRSTSSAAGTSSSSRAGKKFPPLAAHRKLDSPRTRQARWARPSAPSTRSSLASTT
jgi:hypothetical protein